MKLHSKLGKIVVTATATFTCHSVWPFQLFPDTIRLDKDKLTVTQRHLLHKKVTPIQLADLINVEILEAPLFATVRIYPKYMTMAQDWLEVAYIRKEDAYELKDQVNELLKEINSSDTSGGQ